MIKPEELRVGNYVHDRAGKLIKIDYWERPGMVAQNMVIEGMTVHPLTEMCEHLQPIPLTEQWLTDFGFDKRVFTEDGVIYGILSTTIILGRTEDNDLCYFLHGYHNDVHLKYVHSLQNLYFALTGNELIKQ